MLFGFVAQYTCSLGNKMQHLQLNPAPWFVSYLMAEVRPGREGGVQPQGLLSDDASAFAVGLVETRMMN